MEHDHEQRPGCEESGQEGTRQNHEGEKGSQENQAGGKKAPRALIDGWECSGFARWNSRFTGFIKTEVRDQALR
jgi:hypothetical protein